MKKSASAIISDPQEAARAAHLRYSSDLRPGISRRRCGRGFSYKDAAGKTIRDAKTLARIKALAIPPAYHDVWICPHANGHIQATGYDDRGRKQYRYHARWREVRDETKYARMLEFGKALPKIRQRTAKDLRKHGMPREKILAGIVQLLEKTSIRVGNEEYAKENKSYGLTTMCCRHATIEGGTVRFKFRGKSGQQHDIELHDRRLARLVERLQDLPGQELFQYLDEDETPQSISSDDVNGYLQDISKQEFSAKDFRTWTGTVLTLIELQQMEPFTSQTQAKHHIVSAIKKVANCLGNTPSVCRKCYVHPAVLESYLAQRLDVQPKRTLSGLSRAENQLMALLAKTAEHQ